MSMLAGIHDLAYVFTRAGAATGAGLQGDWLTMGANIGAGLGKTMWYGRNQISSLKNAIDPKSVAGQQNLKGKGPTATWIVDVCMIGVTIIDLMNGLLVPIAGAEITSGKGQFALVGEKLLGATPDERDWSGEAATGYTNQNKALQDLITKIQDIDTRMAETIKAQAEQVNQAHKICALTNLGLVIAQGIGLALYLFPPAPLGPALSFKFQILAAAAATIAVLTGEGILIGQSQSHANAFNGLKGEYDGVKSEAEAIKGGFAKIEVKGAEETASAATNFKAISDGLSEYTAPPSVVKLVDEAGNESERELVSALIEDTPAASTTPTPTPDGATPAPEVPAFTPPTLAQVTAASSQATKLSGQASQHMNLFNQAMGSVQQLASMGQQGGQGAAPPAEEAAGEAVDAEKDAAPEEAALESDAQGAGAAAGGGGAERAPVDVAAAFADKREDQTPGERVL